MKAKRILCMVLGLLAVAGAAQADRLFVSVQAADPDQFSKATLEARRVVPNVDAIVAGADTLELRLFNGDAYQARLSGLERRGDSDVTWRGFLGDGYRATITAKDGVVVGLIYTPHGVYEISPLRDGGQGFSRIDQSLYEPCATDGPRAVRPAAKGPEAPVQPAGANVMLTVLGVYTDQARIGAGGPAGIAATIQAAIDNANTGFIDSNAEARYDLVHTAEVGWVENGNGSAALSWVTTDPQTNYLRNQYRADMVGMTIENWGAFCGVAFVMRNPGPGFSSSAFQVTRRACAVGNLTYAHEHGHNQGFEHDPANGAPPGSASHPFAFGHYVNGSYRSIMSYSNQCTQGCTRVPHWSNPNVTHNGVPTGIAGQRHNALASDLNDGFTELFRDGGIQSSLSGSCPGNVTLNVTNATPNTELVAVIGTAGGTFQLQQTSCAGVIVGMQEPIRPLGPFFSDASGNASKVVNLSGADCSRQIMAFDRATCTDSDSDPVP